MEHFRMPRPGLVTGSYETAVLPMFLRLMPRSKATIRAPQRLAKNQLTDSYAIDIRQDVHLRYFNFKGF